MGWLSSLSITAGYKISNFPCGANSKTPNFIACVAGLEQGGKWKGRGEEKRRGWGEEEGMPFPSLFPPPPFRFSPFPSLHAYAYAGYKFYGRRDFKAALPHSPRGFVGRTHGSAATTLPRARTVPRTTETKLVGINLRSSLKAGIYMIANDFRRLVRLSLEISISIRSG